jgi:nicotinamidase/pyrazinamidase
MGTPVSRRQHREGTARRMARMARFDPRTALIVVDMQNDFADPRGGLYVAGGELLPAGIDSLVDVALAAGAMVVYSQDWHPPATPHFAKDGGIWPVHCVRDTWGAELHPGLRVRGPVIRKGVHGEDGYSAFSMRDPEPDRSGAVIPTELTSLLASRQVDRVVVCGLATDYCVRATALDARVRALPTTVLGSLIRAVDLAPGDGDRAIAEMAAAGVVVEA